MTTAHRPTFDPARGGTGKNEGDLSKLSQQYSSRDMPSHMSLKYRQKGQAHPDEVSAKVSNEKSWQNKTYFLKNYRREIEEKEQSTTGKDRRSRDSRESIGSLGSGPSSKRQKLDDSQNLDADDPLDEIDENDSDLDDDSDDEAELMAELERIRKERTAEKAEKDARDREEQEKIRQENILHGNPLLTGTSQTSVSEFKVRRRWDDDVVFKNCARGIDERKKTPNFINDAIRSEFHRKFMEKYIK